MSFRGKRNCEVVLFLAIKGGLMAHFLASGRPFERALKWRKKGLKYGVFFIINLYFYVVVMAANMLIDRLVSV